MTSRPSSAMTPEGVRDFVLGFVAKVTGLPPHQLDSSQSFFSLGFTSLDAVALARAMGEHTGVGISPTAAWDFPTIDALVGHCTGASARTAAVPVDAGVIEPIAIIGLGCRFPGAQSPAAFFDLLSQGHDPIDVVPRERWNADDYFSADIAAPARMVSRRGGFLPALDTFDAAFFRMSPREAAHLDPRQRLMLEIAWEAFEDAGVPPLELAGSSTGVFVATLAANYGTLLFEHHLELVDAYSGTGNGNSVTANRLSYFFDLHGPSLAVDTACSGSLVAVHLACQSLLANECTQALAGGVNVILKPDESVFFSKTGALSPDGVCRVFDRKANGIVRSEGAGCIVLKRLSAAVADGDRIYAVVRATAVNQDGATNGLMAPSGQAQRELLRQAYQRAAVAPGRVQYVEAHGTGTALGDPIEVGALAAVIAEDRPADWRCAIGSVKSNIGHTEAAAGMAGLIKTALAIHKRIIPGNLHFDEPNPLIPFHEMALAVQDHTGAWPQPDEPLVAGVSAFGFAGTNAHVVLGEAPARTTDRPRSLHERTNLLLLSARSEDSLRQAAAAYADRLADTAEPGELCRAAATRRSHLEHRLAVAGISSASLVDSLRAFVAGNHTASQRRHGIVRLDRQPPVAFLFSGQGSQWARMGRGLFARHRAFREVIEECDAHFTAWAGCSLIAELARDRSDSRIDETELAQPAIFAVQAGLSALWRSFGVHPAIVLGQSVGEAAAAFAAGALSLKDAFTVVCVRSRLMKRLEGLGKTATVALPVDEVEAQLAPASAGLSIAGTLSPTLTLVSGPVHEMEEWIAEVGARGLFVRALPVDLALHGPQMEPLRDEMLAGLAALAPIPATIPFVSSVTAGEVPGTDLGPEYWYRNLRDPYRFSAAFEYLLREGCTQFLEVSPHPMLVSAVAPVLTGRPGTACFGSLRRDADETACLFDALGALYTGGCCVQWDRVFDGRGPVLDLPLYRWHRERYWFDQLVDPYSPAQAARTTASPPGADGAEVHPLLGRPLYIGIVSRERIWEARLSETHPQMLAGHKVQGSAVLPASAYVELGLAAARELEPSAKTIRLESLTFVSGLMLQAERVVQTIIQRDEHGAAFRIVSAPPGSSEWTLHGRGTLAMDTVQPIAERLAPPLESCESLVPVPTEQHYDALARQGLEYAGAFRALSGIWRAPGEAVGCIERTRGDDSTNWLCHPALLDACLQLAAAARTEAVDDGFRLPTAVEAFDFYARLPDRFWCHALAQAAQNVDDDRFRADLTLLTDDGTVLARARGVAFERVGSQSLAIRDSIRQWLYELEWRPADLEAADLPPVADVVAQLERESPALARDLDLAHYANQWPVFDSLSVAYVWEALTELGVPTTPGTTLDPDESAARAGIAPRHRRFWHRLLAMLREDGILDAAGTVTTRVPVAASKDIADEIRARFPKAQAEVELVVRGGARMAALLRGEADPLEILFTHDGDDLLERLYRDSLFMRFYNAAIREAIEAAAQSATADRPFRILEIGGGTGSTTHHVLPALSGRPCEYVFTDVSPRFVEQAKAKFAAFDSLSYRVLDIEQDPDTQPGAGERFDVVIAANVLHATVDLRQTLAHVRKVLMPGGWLLLLEGPGRQRWLDLIVGGTDGWWRFSDDLRVDYPLLPPETWARALSDAGFGDIAPIVDPTPQPPQFVMIARAAARAVAACDYRWLLVGEAGGLGGRLAQCVWRRGAECHCLDVASLTAPSTVSILTAPGRPWRVVYLAALESPRWDQLSSAALAESEGTAIFGAVELIQALVQTSATARVWFVTRGAQPAGAALPVDVGQSRMWGVGRVTATEHPEIWGGLLDLSPLPDALEVDRLINEVLSGTGEDQIAHRGANRFVARLVRRRAHQGTTEPWTLRPDAAYLITGGLRGIGAAVAERMIQRGARHLILVSRTALPPRRAWQRLHTGQPGYLEVQAVRRLEALGAEVCVATFDVAGDGNLSQFLATYDEEGRPPIRGVVHSAGLIQDRLIAQMTRKTFADVTHPKVRGAWLLHEAFAHADLDFFVLFSSATSLLGTFGQANYAAGNAFLDALAHHRRALGWPATTINWGLWGEIGIVARLGRQDQLAYAVTIRPELGLDALEHVLHENAVQVAAMPTDWSVWRRMFPKGHEKPLLLDLLETRETPSPATGRVDAAAGALDALSRAPEEQRTDLASAYVAEVVGSALRLPASQLDVDTPLPTLGLDSIMAIEIRNRLEGDLGVSVSIVELLQGASVRHLATRIVRGVRIAETSTSGPAERGDGDINATSGTTASPVARIPRLPDHSGLLPCSPAQESLWFLETVNDSRVPVYNIAVAATLTTRLDPDTMRRALDHMIRRHEPLRTGFCERDGRPWQRISTEVEPDFHAEDLAHFAGVEQEIETEQRAVAFAKLAFDLDAPSLARFLLLNTRDRACFVLSVHHLVFDGWSAGVFVRELTKCYDAMRRGTLPVLAPLPISFADYASWLLEERQPEVERQTAYWLDALRDWRPLDLPIDAPRPARPSFHGAKAYFDIDARVTAQIRQLAQRASATPFMVFAAALGVTLHLESEQTNIVIGTTPSQRELPELAGLIGYFVNMLPLSLRCHREDTFADILAGVRKTTLNAFANQSVPLERVRQAIRMQTGRRTPAVQAVLTLQNSPIQMPPTFEAYKTLDNGTAKFELVLNIVEHTGHHDGWWEYATDLFRPETIKRVADRFDEVLSFVVADPTLRVSQLFAHRAATSETDPPHAEEFRLPSSPLRRATSHEHSGR